MSSGVPGNGVDFVNSPPMDFPVDKSCGVASGSRAFLECRVLCVSCSIADDFMDDALFVREHDSDDAVWPNRR